MRGAGVKAVSPAKRGRSGATRLEAGEHTRTLTVRRCPSTTTTSCGRRTLRIRHFLAVANICVPPATKILVAGRVVQCGARLDTRPGTSYSSGQEFAMKIEGDIRAPVALALATIADYRE